MSVTIDSRNGFAIAYEGMQNALNGLAQASYDINQTFLQPSQTLGQSSDQSQSGSDTSEENPPPDSGSDPPMLPQNPGFRETVLSEGKLSSDLAQSLMNLKIARVSYIANTTVLRIWKEMEETITRTI